MDFKVALILILFTSIICMSALALGNTEKVIELDPKWEPSAENSSNFLMSLGENAEAKAAFAKEGYELAIQSVDIDGNKVFLVLTKDGEVVDSSVIIPANEVDDTYIYSRPGNPQAIRVHFKNSFRGADQNLATIDNVTQTSDGDDLIF